VKVLQHQSDLETCRVLLLRRGRTEVLLLDESGLRFPWVEIPRWERMTENLTSRVKDRWGCEAIRLFALRDILKKAAFDDCFYQVLECSSNGETCQDNAAWTPICSLSAERFRDSADYEALKQLLTTCNTSGEDTSTPLAKSGWFGDLQNWISVVTRPLGFELRGPFRQLNAGSSFSLIRFETNGPAVWFKAVGEPNRHEFGVTLKLAALFPRFLPRVIAARADWSGWLSIEADGTSLSETREYSLWESAAADWARLQIESLGETQQITASGAKDLRCAALSDSVQPFFGVLDQIMRQQIKTDPPILNENELRRLEKQIYECLRFLQSLAIPDTLGHLDLNPGNVIVARSGCVFLDWAEAHVGNPFVSFEYLREQFRRCVSRERSLEIQITKRYTSHWLDMVPAERITAALAMAPLAAVFTYAAGSNSWKDQNALRDQKTAAYLRSLARRMNREAILLSERGTPCLN
jgi:hypothetical protein